MRRVGKSVLHAMQRMQLGPTVFVVLTILVLVILGLASYSCVHMQLGATVFQISVAFSKFALVHRASGLALCFLLVNQLACG